MSIYSLDGEFFNTVPDLPFAITTPPGAYELTIQDLNDCTESEQILVESPVETVVDLGEDITITLGDSVQLEAFVNFDVAEIIWNRTEISTIVSICRRTTRKAPLVFCFRLHLYFYISISIAKTLLMSLSGRAGSRQT